MSRELVPWPVPARSTETMTLPGIPALARPGGGSAGPRGLVRRLADRPGAALLPLGSAGAKAAAVICGEADAYVHSGGQYEWDSAAPVAVARAAGLPASRIDGSKLAYNQASPSVPDILICRAALADLLLGAISSVRRPDELARTGLG